MSAAPRGRALSVRQPWASLLVAGVKTVETRSWRTRHRGPLLIHAASGGVPPGWSGGLDSPVAVACAELLAPGRRRPDPTFPVGAIVGKVDVVDCVPVEEAARIDEPSFGAWGGAWTERDLGDYDTHWSRGGRWAWILDHPRIARPPVPLRGRLGLFPVPPGLAESGA